MKKINQPSQPIRYMRLSQILEVFPVSPATLWRMVAEKRFPTPIKLSPRVTVWRTEDVIAWQNAQVNSVDVPPKSDQVILEYPIFSPHTGNKTIRKYEHNGNTIEVRPGVKHGLATIYDKDIWVYCISHLIRNANSKELNMPSIVKFTAYQFTQDTKKRIVGNIFKRLSTSLERLSETLIKINLKQGEYAIKECLPLVSSFKIDEKGKGESMIDIEVKISPNILELIKHENILLKDLY